jgi:membrane-associated phospholipid phosphatase
MAQRRGPRRSLLEAPADAAHSLRPAVVTIVAGYAALAVILLGVGYLLTHTLDSSVGRWDEHVNEWFVRHRSAPWNDVTSVATRSFNTEPVVLVAALVVGFLSLRKRFREAAFLTLALVVEITVFLSVTFLVARPRPDVPRMNSTPATSSFPSGHTAAATVLFVGVAVIIACATTKRFVRVLAGVLAAAIAILVGFARVYRGLHHPTDVFVGALFGLACLAVAAMAVRSVAREPSAASGAADEGSRRVRPESADPAVASAQVGTVARFRTSA